ncbi:cytochrome c biogenesis CcdA family protein [Rubrobacter aplysinae]|uniref:cytochrome c biogenesis CcdA family protein n=1 Tax=Rubrobacter aplysinae TaxID=909625 RepID=UPI00069EFE27|nr:cytochrome c biogenesis protein CcdA [Rubrobacter aplysinae]
MNALQELATQWLTSLGALLPLGFAFGAGIVSAVNPCGFAMLPAYLSLYLGSQDAGFEKRPVLGRALRAVLVGLVVSLGFVLLFGAAGLIVSAGGGVILGAMPWIGVVIGAALILMGVWMLLGKSLYAGAFERLAERVGDPKSMNVRGFFLFGLAYGLASLSCTLPVFLAVMGSSLAAGGFAASAGQFAGYGLGMTSVLVALTLALALFKGGVVSRLRGVTPYVQPISALLLLLAGGYIIYYWWPVLAGGAGPLG